MGAPNKFESEIALYSKMWVDRIVSDDGTVMAVFHAPVGDNMSSNRACYRARVAKLARMGWLSKVGTNMFELKRKLDTERHKRERGKLSLGQMSSLRKVLLEEGVEPRIMPFDVGSEDVRHRDTVAQKMQVCYRQMWEKKYRGKNGAMFWLRLNGSTAGMHIRSFYDYIRYLEECGWIEKVCTNVYLLKRFLEPENTFKSPSFTKTQLSAKMNSEIDVAYGGMWMERFVGVDGSFVWINEGKFPVDCDKNRMREILDGLKTRGAIQKNMRKVVKLNLRIKDEPHIDLPLPYQPVTEPTSNADKLYLMMWNHRLSDSSGRNIWIRENANNLGLGTTPFVIATGVLEDRGWIAKHVNCVFQLLHPLPVSNW